MEKPKDREKVRAIQDQLCRNEIAEGNVRPLNFLLGKLDLPPGTKLELLAEAYDRKAEILAEREFKDKRGRRNFFISPKELEVVAAQSIARELRERTKKLTEGLNTSST